jgi:hypothetical protein
MTSPNLDNDPLLTRNDLRAMFRGVRNALVVAVPLWCLVLYWWLK